MWCDPERGGHISSLCVECKAYRVVVGKARACRAAGRMAEEKTRLSMVAWLVVVVVAAVR